jgi:hypothetical protein
MHTANTTWMNLGETGEQDGTHRAKAYTYHKKRTCGARWGRRRWFRDKATHEGFHIQRVFCEVVADIFVCLHRYYTEKKDGEERGVDDGA